MHSHLPTRSLWWPLAACLLILLAQARALEQTISLKPGWNAVFLELEPVDDAPEAVFAGAPVEMCAAWVPSKAKVASLTDPAAIPKKSPDWHIWQPASSPAAFLNNLRGIKARQALLIKASKAASLVVKGQPVFERQRWIAPSFNFTGFDVDAAAPPSFARFFDGSPAHAEGRVFKLVADKWQPVAGGEPIQRGQAYWVWTSQGSDFQGPVDLAAPVNGEGAMTLENGAPASRLELRSNGTLPVNLAIQSAGTLPVRITADGATGQGLRLSPTRKIVSIQRVLDAAPDAATGLLSLKGGGMNFYLPVWGTVKTTSN